MDVYSEVIPIIANGDYFQERVDRIAAIKYLQISDVVSGMQVLQVL